MKQTVQKSFLCILIEYTPGVVVSVGAVVVVNGLVVIIFTLGVVVTNGVVGSCRK